MSPIQPPPFRLSLDASNPFVRSAHPVDHPYSDADQPMKTITALVVRAIDFCAQYAWPVIAAAILLTLVSSWYAATHFAMTTDVNQLISPNIPWRQREAAFEKAFPQFELIVAVIDAPTPELVDEATSALVQRLSQQKDLFRSIEQPKGGSFFAQNGLLFEPTADLAPQMKMLTQAQRLVQVLAGDPSLRGVIQALQFGLLGVQGGQITLDNMTWPMTLAAERDRESECRPAGELFLARTGRRAAPRRPTSCFASCKSGRRSTIPSLSPASGRPTPSGRPRRSRFRIQISGAPAPDRPGADGGRGIRHDQGECGAQRHRDDRRRALHSVAGAALGAHHFRGVRLPCRRAFHHGGARHADGRHAQSDIGLFCGAVRRSRRRFRPAIQRPLSRRAARDRRSARGALASGQARRRAADACGVGDGGRLLVVPADGLQGRFRTRPHRRRRHADRVRHQHHAVAGAVKPAQAAARAGPARLRGAGAGRQFPCASIACRS